MKPLLKFIVLTVQLAAADTFAQQTFVFAPSPFDPQNHYGTQDPFLFFTTDAPSVRYQQVYANTDFSRVQGPLLISEISCSSGASALNFTLPTIQINFSTTQKQPDG